MRTLSPMLRTILLALVVLASASRVAQAQGDDVHELLAAAVAEYDGGNYDEAYALFLRVHQIQPSARSERALGKAAFELRRYGECVRWLEASLADERNPLTDEMRTEVNGLLSRARAFVGTFELHPSVEGATVEVDGAPVEGTTLQLDLGDHELVVRAVGYADVSRRVSVHGGETESIDVPMVAVATGPGGPVEDPGGTMRDIGWATLITGGVFAVGGVVATAIWASTVGTLNANLQSGACWADPATESIGPMNPSTCYDQQNRYRTALPFIYVGYVGGGVLLATGLGLILGAPGPATADAAPQAGAVRCDPFADLGVSCQLAF